LRHRRTVVGMITILSGLVSSSIFRYTLFELPEIMAQLLERKTESKQAFQRVKR
jgi:hypothetical protein